MNIVQEIESIVGHKIQVPLRDKKRMGTVEELKAYIIKETKAGSKFIELPFTFEYWKEAVKVLREEGLKIQEGQDYLDGHPVGDKYYYISL